MMKKNKEINFIDLFAGCGGLSEGFSKNDKMNAKAHVEWEIPMVNTLRNRLKSKWKYSESKAIQQVIHFDIQKTNELLHGNWSEETKKKYAKTNCLEIQDGGLDKIINGDLIDVIIGGPPCQAYSIAGRAQDKDSMQKDYRNYLFEGFAKIVDHYKPKIFVFENVPGLLSAKVEDKFVLDLIHKEFDEIGYEIRKREDMFNSVYSASDFNVPQERKRVIIFGVRKDSKYKLEDLYSSLDNKKSELNKKTVKDAIGHLPKIYPLEQSYKSGRRNVSHEVISDNIDLLHVPRFHNERDINIFYEWVENNMNSLSNKEKIEYYYLMTKKKTNHNKYRSLDWSKPSPTIVAHLYKDGLMFIHPDKKQARSITMREAALLQSFPTDYEFIGSNASIFKMIGNAVPVLFAEKISEAVSDVLEEKE